MTPVDQALLAVVNRLASQSKRHPFIRIAKGYPLTALCSTRDTTYVT